jgi:hypothetical protein
MYRNRTDRHDVPEQWSNDDLRRRVVTLLQQHFIPNVLSGVVHLYTQLTDHSGEDNDRTIYRANPEWSPGKELPTEPWHDWATQSALGRGDDDDECAVNSVLYTR